MRYSVLLSPVPLDWSRVTPFVGRVEGSLGAVELSLDPGLLRSNSWWDQLRKSLGVTENRTDVKDILTTGYR